MKQVGSLESKVAQQREGRVVSPFVAANVVDYLRMSPARAREEFRTVLARRPA